MILWHLKTVYVASRHLILRGAGNIFYLLGTSTMIVQAMQTCTVVDVVFFSLTPFSERIHVLRNTHKDTYIYNKIATFSNVNMHVSSNITFNSKYCAR